MFRRRCWLGALCLVLAAMLPTYVSGAQVVLPVIQTLSIPASPLIYPSSPPILAFVPTQIIDRAHRLTVWVSTTKQAALRRFYSKYSFTRARLALRVYQAISAATLSRPPSLTFATRTLGGSISPTRTRTTTIHNPALPEPAYARFRGRSCTPHRPSESSKRSSKSSSSRLGHRYTTAFSPRLAHHLHILHSSFSRSRRTRTGVARFPAPPVQKFSLVDAVTQVLGVVGICIHIYLFQAKIRKVHYRCELMIEAHQFSKLVFEWDRPWTAECLYNNRDLIEWELWDAIDRQIWSIRMDYARIRGFRLKVRVTRERKVCDWSSTIFGLRSVEVPQDGYHGTDVFETEDEFVQAAPDLDLDLELPRREWNELARDWLRDPPTPPSSPPRTPSLPQGRFLRRVRIADPDDPDWEGEEERMF
ncbi:hypothetical protein FRC06_003898 [Ceratobasidium sp. 370]|nr:hypothetical protein FRC06_003898 [Ceratobasidium sp. 370]